MFTTCRKVNNNHHNDENIFSFLFIITIYSNISTFNIINHLTITIDWEMFTLQNIYEKYEYV